MGPLSGVVVYDVSSVCHCAVGWDLLDFIAVHEEDRVGSFGASLVVALREATELFAEGGSPYLLHDRVLGESSIFINRHTCDWVYDRVGQMFQCWHWVGLTPFWQKIGVAWL